MQIKVVMKSVIDSALCQKSKEELAVMVQELLKKERENSNDGFMQRFLLKSKTRQLNEIVDILEIMQKDEDYSLYKPFDNHFNQIVAGLMGATCYMKDDFEKLYSKTEKQILRISNTVLTGGHHSTFDHSHLTLQITGIPKALAMVLNNEKEYTTAEKSARYTIMQDVEPTNNELYEKWTDTFKKIIGTKYGENRPFFDEKGIKVKKLSQENARYLLPVTTPTNMVYTTSYRQLNYLCHWLNNEIANPSNDFYKIIKDDMAEFVSQIDNLGLYLENLQDGKDRQLSLFGEGLVENYFSNTYQQELDMSLACLAQKQRHRTLNLNIINQDFDMNKLDCYVPPILKSNSKLENEFVNDFKKVKDSLPQGTMVHCAERGTIENFELIAKERLCSCAQKEVRDLVHNQAKEYQTALLEKRKTLNQNLNLELFLQKEKSRDELSAQEDKVSLEVSNKQDKNNEKQPNECKLDNASLKAINELNRKIKINENLIQKITPLTNGARCTSGYKCATPCGFKDGITLESEI